ncbi:competence protein ComK [Mammaliicoccus sp. Dog046]|uniref:competence protein ComK n=1 Tax=Mammaliicoccus sp. Dog046 TaxID=3034233 RepID=UPI002B25F14D|nr:competence protein ComK [Mammaliicoccus sp. Dog046]WQK86373.1 competence protein ComK [Mammaliicoccus sp. Dog046]
MTHLINPNMLLLKQSQHPSYKYQIEYLNAPIQHTNQTVQSLINDALRIEGASFKTREQYGKYILNIYKLTPLLIYATQDFVLFPTSAKYQSNYMLINCKQILNIKQHQAQTKLQFKNGTSTLIALDYHLVSKKMGESLRLVHHQKNHIMRT